jgi:uncharacterized phiE125 gp8 family phage protein
MAISYLDNIFNFVDYEYLNPSQNRYGNLVEQGSVATQVVTTDELKAHLRITTNDENSLLGTYILAATRMVENYCNRHLIKTEYKLWFKDLPSKFSLYYPDVSYTFTGNTPDGLYYLVQLPDGSITHSKTSNDNWYSDITGNPVVVNIRTVPTPYKTFEEISGNLSVPFYFKFHTGISDTATGIPDAIKQAIKLIAGDLYYFREDRKRQFPMASEILLQPYKCYL